MTMTFGQRHGVLGIVLGVLGMTMAAIALARSGL